jgi:hypothetical protein
VTASTRHHAHHFKGKERLVVLHRGVLKIAAEFGWRLEAWAVFSNHYHFVAWLSRPTQLHAPKRGKTRACVGG